MKTSRLLVSFLTAAIAASVLLAFGDYLPESQAGTITAEASTAELSKGKFMPWIPVLLLDDTEQAKAVLVSPKAVLLTEYGQTAQLTATVYDASEEVLDVKLKWSSSNPQAVFVDETGLIKSWVGVGSAVITASAPGAISNAVSVIVATPVDGAVLVSDDQVVGAVTPVDPDAPLGIGMRVNVRLSGITPPAAGTIILGTGEQPVGGKVVSAVQDGDDVDAVLEAVPVDEMFADLLIEQEVDLSREVPTIAKFFADNYDVNWTPGGVLEFTLRKTAHSSALTSRALMSRTGVPMGTQVLNPNANLGPFECKGGSPFVLDGLPASLQVVPSLGWSFRYDSNQGGLQNVLVTGIITGTFKAGIIFTVALNAAVTCETKVGEIPIPLATSGALSAFALYVPLGVGFEIGGKITLPQLGYELQTDAKATVFMGVQCPGGDNCSMIRNLDPEAKTKHGWKTPDTSGTLLGVLSQLHLEPSTSGYLASGLELGFIPQLNIPARTKLLKAKAGVKLAGNFAIVEGQMADEGYKSDYLLSQDSSIGAGLEFDAFGRLFHANILQVDLLTITDKLAESPKVLSAKSDVKDFVTGDSVTFTVSLDPQHINYPIIGYNVAKVSIYRRTEDDTGGVGPADLLAEVVPANGVTDVQMTWTADVDGTIDGDYFAFVETKALPFPYFGELETATITTGGYGCIYSQLGDTIYIKTCDHEITHERIKLRHSNGDIRYTWGDEVIMEYYDNVTADSGHDTYWVNYSNFPVDGYDCVETGAGWTAYKTVIRPPTGLPSIVKAFEIGKKFPNLYFQSDDVNVLCWPDYNAETSACGAYACPPINSIIPLSPFPGDCHVWWDHFDEQGIWHECTY